jgi:signal transduction histidine kinase/DNA-binding response OmpR family regulator
MWLLFLQLIMNLVKRTRWAKPAVWGAGATVLLVLLTWRFFGGDGVDRAKIYKIAYGNDTPLHFKGQDGLPSGLAVELVREAALTKKIQLEWVEAAGDWRSRADFLVLFSIQPDRFKSAHITKPYLQTETCFILPANGPHRTVSDLEGARISYVNYGIHRDNLAALLPTMSALPVQSSREALEKVASGQADAAYLSDYAVTPALLEGGFQSPLRRLPSHAPQVRMGIASSFENAHVANVIRDGMKTLVLNDRMAPIVERWGLFPNLTTDQLDDLLNQERKVRALILGVFLLFLSVAVSLWLVLKLRRHAFHLREAGQIQSAILNGLAADVALIDSEGAIQMVNESWLRETQPNTLHGVEYGVGRNYLEVCLRAGGDGSGAAADVAQGIRRVLNGKAEDFNIEYPCSSAAGPRWSRLMVTPVRDTASAGAVVMHLDISGRKRIDMELALARDAALESSRLKTEFLANMSHEIRTPMNGVVGMAHLLLDTSLTAEQREYAEIINKSAEDLLTIINDILDLSKIEAGKLAFECIDFELRKTVEDTLGLLAERAREKGLEIASLVYRDVPVRLRGDPLRLRQVLVNLVSNAIKFTPKGEVVVRVTLETETESHAILRFSVSDTGIGISPQMRSRIFDAFTQADGSTTRKYGGTGLGLAISKQLVERMEGRIDLESTLGQGSTFWFTATFEKQEPALAEALAEVPLEGLRLLLIDDNVTQQQILQHQIEGWRMRLSSAAHPDGALAAMYRAVAEGQPYDVAILERQLPGMDGWTLARTIKADPALAHTRLILLTSTGDRPMPDDLESGGLEDCLTKPLRQSRLFDCLSRVVGGPRGPLGGRSRTIEAASSIASDFAASPQRAAARILLAEDNTINQRVALALLEKLGYSADVVANGREALEALQRTPYDIVLMDCQMPEMDGYEATRQIRSRFPAPRSAVQAPPYIIALTANAMHSDREKCLAAGMDDYIAKPLNVDQLKIVLELWQQRSALPEPPEGPAVPSSALLELPGASVVNSTAPSPDSATESNLVDLDCLKNVTNGDPEQLRQFLDLYFTQADEILKQLEQIIRSGSTTDVRPLAHKLKGVSLICGMTGIIDPLGKLEQLESEGNSADFPAAYAQVTRAYARIRQFLNPTKPA